MYPKFSTIFVKIPWNCGKRSSSPAQKYPHCFLPLFPRLTKFILYMHNSAGCVVTALHPRPPMLIAYNVISTFQSPTLPLSFSRGFWAGSSSLYVHLLRAMEIHSHYHLSLSLSLSLLRIHILSLSFSIPRSILFLLFTLSLSSSSSAVCIINQARATLEGARAKTAARWCKWSLQRLLRCPTTIIEPS